MSTKRMERLGKLLSGPEGIAIAITGQWGVGKTYFWKEYLDYHVLKRKQASQPLPKQEYAYVSVFGIENLGDLKAAIVEQLVGKIPEEEKVSDSFFKISKRIINESKNLNLKGVNIGGNLLFSLIFSQISNALICIDDLERKSDKLHIKDILGLVDFLKNQKNCKVIVIVNDEKDDAGIFKDYKEKVFDEYFIIKDVVEAINNLTKNHPNVLIDNFKHFHNVFALENIRFYKKAIRIYNEISNYLPSNVSDATLKQIIKSILVFLVITDIPEMNITWADLEIKNSMFSKKKKTDNEIILAKFFGSYFILNEWDALLKKLFLQDHNQWSISDFKNLAESDLMSEEQNFIKDRLSKLIDDFYNFNVNHNFGNDLYDFVVKNIDNQSLSNVEFYIKILMMLGLSDKSILLEAKLLDSVKKRIINARRPINEVSELYAFGSLKDNILYKKVEEIIKNTIWNNYDFKDIIDSYLRDGVIRYGSKNIIMNSNKEDWQKYIFEDTKEYRFAVIRDLWDQNIVPEKTMELRQWIKEILRENGRKSIGNDVAADHAINLLENGNS